MSKLDELRLEGLKKIEEAKDTKELQDLRVFYLGKKGPIQEVMKMMKDLPKEEKPAFGQQVNEVKQLLSVAIENKKVELEELDDEEDLPF